MKLYVSATYQPNEDEVWVDFRSTEDDESTLSLADSLELTLLMEVKNDAGAAIYSPITKVAISKDYARPDKNYEIRFRNPLKKLDLWVEVIAQFGGTSIQKRVLVGQALPSHTEMTLPDNVLYGRDPFDFPESGEDLQRLLNENLVVLAPEIRDYLKKYDFTLSQAPESFEGLSYTGGGNRLLMQNQTNQFDLQEEGQPPWVLSAFMFLEGAMSNLVPNSFFMNVTGSSPDFTRPAGFKAQSTAMVVQTVDFDYAVSASAKIWNVRFLQNMQNPAADSTLSLENSLDCDGDTDYCFSFYTKVKTLSNKNRVLTLCFRWLNGETLIAEDVTSLNSKDFLYFNLAAFTMRSPLGANKVIPIIRIETLAGDDTLISVLGPQVEEGLIPTTRVLGDRLDDILQVDEYNAYNQKIRIECVAGFSSAAETPLCTGPLEVSFNANALEVFIPAISFTTSTPFIFAAGDFLDLTIEHQSGKNLVILREGQVIHNTPLPDFSTGAGPLIFSSRGVELIRLHVFSRRGD